jgi:hypothetical protein
MHINGWLFFAKHGMEGVASRAIREAEDRRLRPPPASVSHNDET